MQAQRHTTIYPTTQGWFLELPEPGDAQDAYTYGPVNTAFEANWYLRTISRPTSVTVERDMRPVPTTSPNGTPVTGVKQALQAPSFGESPARFITSTDLFYTFLYDSLCDIGYEIDGDRITAVRPGFFWSPQAEVAGKFLGQAGTEAGWKTISKVAVATLLKTGRTYEPVVIPGLPYRPAMNEYLQEFASISLSQ
jgi:hypothetical protein